MTAIARLHLLACALLLVAHVMADDWGFKWPNETRQCEDIHVEINGGSPPWKLQIIPIGQQPLYWQLSAPPGPVNATHPARVTIPLQVSSGTPYVVLMSDSVAYAVGSNNPTTIQTVQTSSDTSCLSSASPAKKDFDFQVYGSVTQCERTFSVTWTTSIGIPPYYCTVVPLDGAWNPWNVMLVDQGSNSDAQWRVNMTAGSHFTVVMHDGYALGRGGVGQIYRVESSSNTTCITQTTNGASNWPSGLQAQQIAPNASPFGPGPSDSGSATVPDRTNQVTAVAGAGSSSPSDSSMSGGAIAGAAVGAAIGVAAIAGLIFWLLRRRRRGQYSPPAGDVDLIGGSGSGEVGLGYEPKLEPYTTGYTANQVGPAGRSGQEAHPLSVLESSENRSSSWGGQYGEIPASPGSSVPFLAGQTASASDRAQKGHLGWHGFQSGQLSQGQTSTLGSLPPSSATAASTVGSSLGTDTKVRRPTPAHADNTGAGALDRQLPASPAVGGLPNQPGQSSSPEFRRHTDAGQAGHDVEQERQVVDLPPMYTDVPSGQNRPSGVPHL